MSVTSLNAAFSCINYDRPQVLEIPELPLALAQSILDTKTGQLLTWGMRLEDYASIKAIGECPIYHGPKPPAYGQTSWGWPEQHVLFYESKGIESVHNLKAQGISQEEFQAEQRELQRWYKITKEMREIQYNLYDVWIRDCEPHRIRFLNLMDRLSSWGCYECEVLYRFEEGHMKRHGCCDCHECEGCGSKFCYGCPVDDDY
jgi:hypothetical protein